MARIRFVRPGAGRVLLAVAAVVVGVAGPARPLHGAAPEAAVPLDGWWNRLTGAQEGEPANPVRPIIPPAPTTVPEDAIAVGVAGGEPDKVAAVQIDLEAPTGTTVASLRLILKEAAGDGAQVNGADSIIVACPIDGAWGPGDNGPWGFRPIADCEQGRAEGARADDGTWTFDLTALGRRWLDPVSPLGTHGVLLTMESAAAPVAQVSFLNVASGGITVVLDAVEPVGSTTETSVDTIFDSFDGSGFDLALPSFGVPVTGAPPVVELAPPAPDRRTAQPAAAQRDAEPGGVFSQIPWGVGLLVPAVLVLAGAVSATLAPDAQPTAVRRRTGGVSRALAQRTERP